MFFSFCEIFKRKTKKIKSNKKGMNKECTEILKNIELISFIKKNRIESYKKFINDKLKNMQDYKEFLKYLNSYWFKKPDNEYNFSDILQKFEGNIDNLNTFYFTSNITESIHAKINYYLPRHISSEYNFINLLGSHKRAHNQTYVTTLSSR